VVFLGDRLLDLEHEIAGRPHVVGAGENLRAGRRVLVVGDRGAEAGTRFDEHVMPVAHEFVHTRRSDRDAILVVLDLAGDSDLHCDPSTVRCAARAGAPLPR